MRIESSTIAHNYSRNNGRGGGLYFYDFSSTPSTATIVNSTFSGNEADISGSIGASGTPRINIYGSTITENHARVGNGGVTSQSTNGVIDVDMTVHFSIIAGNTGTGWFGAQDVHGALNAASSYNLIGAINHSGLQNGVNGNTIIGSADPGLTALGDHGGPTETHALHDDSLAVAAGDAAFAELLGLDVDQRGFSRTGAIDLGALQLAFGESYGAA